MRYGIAHDENWTFQCPCGGEAIGRFVIPTHKGKFAIIGTCHRCFERGNDATTTAILPSTEDDDFETLLVSCSITLKEK